MRGRVVVAGSINADVVVRTERLPAPGETVHGDSVEWHPGGKAANQAAAAAVAGASVSFHGCVGDDENGLRLRAALADFGVDTSIRTVDGPSGLAVIAVDRAGENSIIVIGGANDALAVDDVVGLGLRTGDVVCAPLESPPGVVAAFLRDAVPATRILNPAPVERCDAALLAAADIVVVNEHEAERLDLSGAPAVITTLGPDGARVAAAGVETHVPGPSVTPVDTTGAGDCFVGTLATRLSAGRPLLAAVQDAVDAAARSVTRAGAMSSYRAR